MPNADLPPNQESQQTQEPGPNQDPGLDQETVAAFIQSVTEVCDPPLLDGIKLNLAQAAKPLIAAGAEQVPQLDLSKPYWAFAWTAGLALARYIQDHPQIVAGRRVMDFGCGAGHVGIVAKQAGAAEVVAYDRDSVACIATYLNAKLNQTAIQVREGDPVSESPGTFDVILVGDLFTNIDQFIRLTPWFLLQAAEGCDVLFSDPDRSAFLEIAARRVVGGDRLSFDLRRRGAHVLARRSLVVAYPKRSRDPHARGTCRSSR